VYRDWLKEVRYYSGWNASTNLPTGPTTVVRNDMAAGYTEVLTMSATPTVSSGRPTGTEAISSIQTLSREYVNAAGQVVSSDIYFSLGSLKYSAKPNLGTENTLLPHTLRLRQSRVVEQDGGPGEVVRVGLLGLVQRPSGRSRSRMSETSNATAEGT
jgi:hypothetical protein